MFTNYLKVMVRNIKRQKMYALINVVALASGIACSIFMLFWIQDGTSYDKYHKNVDELYRVISVQMTPAEVKHLSTAPNPIGPVLKEQYPEVVNFARYCGGSLTWSVQYGTKRFRNDKLGSADPSLFEMFTFPFIKGDPETAFSDPKSIVLTESMAKKYFDNDDPMGKVIRVSSGHFKITGIIKDVPKKSHLQFDYLFPIENMKKMWGEDMKNWERMRFYTYVQLAPGSSLQAVNQKISGIVKKQHPESNIGRVFLMPIKDVHLHSNFDWDPYNMNKGNINHIYLFSLAAICVLLIACINFTNLATARSTVRAREVGLRKTMGGHKWDLIKQFLGESIVFAFIALIVALILVYLFFPTFKSLSGLDLTLGSSFTIPVILGLLVITILTGFASGSYPAFYLSSFQPVTVLKGASNVNRHRKAYLRKILVVVQFAITITFIISSAVIFSQRQYIRNKDLGFDKNNVLSFFGMRGFVSHPEGAKNALKQNPNVLSVTKGFRPVGATQGTTALDWEGRNPDEKIMLYPIFADYDYLETYKVKLVEGRFFSRDFTSDVNNYVLNKAAVKAMGLKSPVGKRFAYRGMLPNAEPEGIIIGVVEDFHQESLHNPIKPAVFKFYTGVGSVSVRIRPENVAETIAFLKEKYEKIAGTHMPFSYEFIDSAINDFYKEEDRISTILRYITFLTIFIACLGLLGLISFLTVKRSKEVGIRKVMGASVTNVTLILSKDLLPWVLLANIISWPVAWYVMTEWLRNFTYRITIGWWIFPLASLLALVIAFFTISFQTIKAARANPADTLRYE